MDPLHRAAERVVAVRPGSEDLAAAATCVAHHLVCALAARDLPWCRAVTALAGPGTDATLLGDGRTTRAEDAAFANAVLGQSTLAEDLHTPSLVHPGAVVIPAAMALAEEHGRSGAELLTAIVAGYEIAGTFGAAMKTPEFVARGFRPTGVFGVLGAAAAAAVLLRLDVATTESALALAVNMAAGLREWANAGTTDVYVHNGLAARNGILAARLAAAGVTGPPSALTGPAGMAHAYAGGADLSTVEFTNVVHEVEFKRHPTCSAVQTVAELALSMRVPDRIDRVTVHTHRHGTTNPGCDHPGPFASVGQAQMSNQLTVALALTRGSLTVADYADPGPAADLATRVTVVEDPAYTRVYPGRSAARIDVTLTGGRVVTAELADTNPLRAKEVHANLRHMAGPGVATLVAGLPSAPDLAPLAAALRDTIAT